MKNVASLNLSVNSFPLAWKIQINTSPIAERDRPTALASFVRCEEVHRYRCADGAINHRPCVRVCGRAFIKKLMKSNRSLAHDLRMDLRTWELS